MTIAFIDSFRSEWLKTRRSLAAWLVIAGGFFTPVLIIIVRLVHHDKLHILYSSDDFWTLLWKNSWESMAIFLLPMGIILSTSLITQLEYKNNTWKQLHTLPLGLTTIFFSKLAVILFMMFQFFVCFNIGIYLAALVPYLAISGVSYPTAVLPYLGFLKEDTLFFIDCLPVIALQYLISLKYKNFLVPVGTGFLLWILALASLKWKYGYLIPYTYCMYNYLKDSDGGRAIQPEINFHYLAVGYFLIITVISYIFYITRRDKG
jgi:lantibiotic transport system permease protein